MTNNPIAVIREACIRANPSIETYNCECHDGCHIIGRPIRLADVLLALNKKVEKGSCGVAADGRFVYLTGDAGENYFNFFPDSKAETEISWDLKNDSLEFQSPETLLFLSNLLQ